MKKPPKEDTQASPEMSYDAAFYMKQNQVYLPEYFDNENNYKGECNNGELLYDLPQGEDENSGKEPSVSLCHELEDRAELRQHSSPSEDVPQGKDSSRSSQQEGERDERTETQNHLYGTPADEEESKCGKRFHKPLTACISDSKQSSVSKRELQIKKVNSSQKPHRYDELEMTTEWLYNSHSATQASIAAVANRISQVYDEPDANRHTAVDISATKIKTSTDDSENATHLYDEPDVKYPTVAESKSATTKKIDETSAKSVARFYGESDTDHPIGTESKQLSLTAQHVYDQPDETDQIKHHAPSSTNEATKPSQDVTHVHDDEGQNDTVVVGVHDTTSTCTVTEKADGSIEYARVIEGETIAYYPNQVQAEKGTPHYVNQMVCYDIVHACLLIIAHV